MSRSIATFLIFVCLVLSGRAFGQTPEADRFLARAEELAKQGRYDLAIAAAEKAIVIAELALGQSSPELAKPLKALARLYEMSGNTEDAARTYRRAFAVLLRAHADTSEVAQLLQRLDTASARKDTEQTTSRSLGRGLHSSPPSTAAGQQSPSAAEAQESELEANGRGLRGATALPKFPWPPPASSARYDFPQDAFKRYGTFGAVSDAILNALRSSGYVEYSFFQTGDRGVALVTRLEKIAKDGSSAPEQERWPAGFGNDPSSFVDFVRGLFYARPGHYRVIVFILQEASFTQSRQTVTGQAAEEWLTGGANKLPPAFASRPFGKDSSCTALIYEFASDGSASVKGVTSSLTGRQHLQRAGLLALLEQAN